MLVKKHSKSEVLQHYMNSYDSAIKISGRRERRINERAMKRINSKKQNNKGIGFFSIIKSLFTK